MPLFSTQMMSGKTRNCHSGVITIEVKDMPMGEYGLDDVMPPRYSSLINVFDAMSHLIAFESASSISTVVPEEARNTLVHTAVGGFTSPEWRRLLQNFDNLVSLVVPLPFAQLPMQVLILSSSDFTGVCPRLMYVSVATDIPTDEVHDGQLWRRGTTPALRCPVWVLISRLLRPYPTRRG